MPVRVVLLHEAKAVGLKLLIHTQLTYSFFIIPHESGASCVTITVCVLLNTYN